MNAIKGVFIFIAGTAVGSVVTYKLVEKKFRDLADEEIESVKETFKRRLIENDEKECKPDSNLTIEKVDNAVKEINKNNEKLEEIIKSNNYNMSIDMANEDIESQQVEDDDEDYTVPVEVGPDSSVPYIISENEFGEFGNDEKTLIFYSDSILAEDDDIITDPESVIGNALEEFNDPMVERVFVRDETAEIDYIILRSERSYSEVYDEEEN